MYSLEYILALLLMFGWNESEVRYVHANISTRYNPGWTSGYGAFDSTTGTVLLGSFPPALTVDHEYQHAYYWLKLNKNPDPVIKQDFLRFSDNICVGKTIREQARDWTHWPHFVINCVERSKIRLPEFLRDKYYAWLSGPTRRMFMPIALVSRTGER